MFDVIEVSTCYDLGQIPMNIPFCELLEIYSFEGQWVYLLISLKSRKWSLQLTMIVNSPK